MSTDVVDDQARPLRTAAVGWVTRPRAVRLTGGAEPRELVLRGGRPSDATALAAMHARCSMDSIFRRYLFAVPAVSATWQAELLAAALALVAVDGGGAVRASGHVTTLDDGATAELAVLVEDAVQGRGLGTAIARHLTAGARLTGHRTLRMDLLPSSTAAHRVAAGLGPCIAVVGPGVVTLTMPLRVECVAGLAAA